MGGKERNHPQ
jgi:hypothetical protein